MTIYDSLAFCKNHIWENYGSEVMAKNAFSQSDFIIL